MLPAIVVEATGNGDRPTAHTENGIDLCNNYTFSATANTLAYSGERSTEVSPDIACKDYSIQIIARWSV